VKPNDGDGDKIIAKPNDGDGDNLKKTRCSFTIPEKQEIRRLIEADIDKYGKKKSVNKICKVLGIHQSLYYTWRKECHLCFENISNYETGGVKCLVTKCSAKTCYSCLAKAFLVRVENARSSEYGDMSRTKCSLC